MMSQNHLQNVDILPSRLTHPNPTRQGSVDSLNAVAASLIRHRMSEPNSIQFNRHAPYSPPSSVTFSESGVSKAAAPLCNCMKSQADKLCTLRTIEQRQSPVKVDTILSCVKLVSQAAESQLQCSFCQIDCYTLLLTISTFQLIFHWVRAQTHHPEKACDNTSIKLGQYEISKQDATMLKDILVARAFDTTLTSLKLLRSRVNQLVVDAQCKELWDFERAPIQNLQNMTQSLMQTSSVLSKRLRNHF